MKNILLLFLFLLGLQLSAQSVSSNTALTLDEVLESITTDLECTSISNITSPNNAQMHGQNFNSYGSFEFTNEPFFPFEKGIVLSTANASNLSLINMTGDNNWPGDTDLEALIQEPGMTLNATVIEFDFVPFRDKLQVDYIFASKEYSNNFQCSFTDTFAFIVSGPGISDVNSYDHDANPNTPEVSLDLGGLNIATLPGTNIPVNPPNTHDGSANCPPGSLGEFTLSQFFDAQSSGNNVLDFIGQVIPLTAEVDLIPGQTYHIKLVIADRADTLFDSAVFIDADSFVIGTIPEDLPYEPGLPVTLPDCWNATDSANFNLTNECSANNENYLQLFGGNYSITTAAVNADGLNSLDVSFDLLNGCTDVAEANENLLIEYFDGDAWQILDDINPTDIPTPFSENSNNWLTYNYTITSGLSMNLMLRFSRSSGNDLQDDINIANLSFINSTFSNEDFNFKALRLFPNPVKDMAVIKHARHQDINTVELFDIQGKAIDIEYHHNTDGLKLNLSPLAKGIYLIKISVDGRSFTQKIVKK